MEPGTVLNGKYELIAPLGKGGMGEVWHAKRLDLQAEIAVKVMHRSAAETPNARVRFQREARAAAALRSPHVVQILDYGVDEATGTPFISMELLEGESLRARLAREQKLRAADVVEVVAQIGRALTRAHAQQIVHRDLKPENVFLVANEDNQLVKVLDFGIAKANIPGEAAAPTATGVVLGTPHYMSPEQMDSARHVDFRTDLWSLAVIACECMTGARPFTAPTLAELAMKIALGRSSKPSSLGPVPLGFDAWFARATEVDPDRRFQSAAEMVEALRRATNETRSVGLERPVDALEVTRESDSLNSQTADARPEVEPPRAARQRWPLWAAGAALALGGAALALSTRTGPTDGVDAPRATDPASAAVTVTNAALPNAALPNAAVTNAAVTNAAIPNAAVPNPNAAVTNAAVTNAALPSTAVTNAAIPKANAAIPNAALPKANAAIPNAAVTSTAARATGPAATGTATTGAAAASSGAPAKARAAKVSAESSAATAESSLKARPLPAAASEPAPEPRPAASRQTPRKRRKPAARRPAPESPPARIDPFDIH